MWCTRREYTYNNENENKEYDENKRTYPPVPILQCAGADITRHLMIEGDDDNDKYHHKEELHSHAGHVNLSSKVCVLSAMLICHECTTGSLDNEGNDVGRYKAFGKPARWDRECGLFRVEEIDQTGDNHVCKCIYPWKYTISTHVKLFENGHILHNGARRNNSVDTVTYVEFCWFFAPSVRRIKQKHSQSAPMMITQQNDLEQLATGHDDEAVLFLHLFQNNGLR